MSATSLVLVLGGTSLIIYGIVRNRPTPKERAIDASIIVAGLLLNVVASGVAGRAAALRYGGL